MRCEEFFNLLPEEVMVIEYRYSWPGKSAYEVGEATEWGKDIVKRTESMALTKIVTALKNLGITITKEAMINALEQGIINLDGIVENNKQGEK